MNLGRCVLGTAGLGGIWGSVDPWESIDTILYALECGITAIDTAPAYANGESYVGQALKEWDGKLPRISTKVGRLQGFSSDEGYYDYSEAGMKRSVEHSLQLLGVSKLDILFLHDPAHMVPGEAETAINTLVGFREKGYTQRIGLGGNPPAWFAPYLESGVFDVLMEFNKLNACTTVALEEHLPFCIARRMTYFDASPLVFGLLGQKYDHFQRQPPVWLDAKYLTVARQLKAIAEREHMPLSTLAHRFLLSLNYPFHIVFGASDLQQLKNTLGDITQGALPEALVREIMTYTLKKMD